MSLHCNVRADSPFRFVSISTVFAWRGFFIHDFDHFQNLRSIAALWTHQCLITTKTSVPQIEIDKAVHNRSWSQQREFTLSFVENEGTYMIDQVGTALLLLLIDTFYGTVQFSPLADERHGRRTVYTTRLLYCYRPWIHRLHFKIFQSRRQRYA